LKPAISAGGGALNAFLHELAEVLSDEDLKKNLKECQAKKCLQCSVMRAELMKRKARAGNGRGGVNADL